MFLQRPGGQSQFSERLALPATIAAPIRQLLDAIVAEPAADHRLARLAKRAAVSERHLRRLFADQTGTTPARFVERVRVEAARERLERTTTPVETVAGRLRLRQPRDDAPRLPARPRRRTVRLPRALPLQRRPRARRLTSPSRVGACVRC